MEVSYLLPREKPVTVFSGYIQTLKQNRFDSSVYQKATFSDVSSCFYCFIPRCKTIQIANKNRSLFMLFKFSFEYVSQEEVYFEMNGFDKNFP